MFSFYGTGTALSADLFRVGDALEVSYFFEQVFVQIRRSLIITRMGELVLFAGNLSYPGLDRPLWPELERFDITMRADPTGCRVSGAIRCEFLRHDLLVQRSGQAATRSANGGVEVGGLTVVGWLFESTDLSVCEAPRFGLSVLGFVAPVP